MDEYYRPYAASVNSDSDSESAFSGSFSRSSSPLRPSNAGPDIKFTSSTLRGSQEYPDFSELARGLAKNVTEASGPTFNTTKQEDAFSKGIVDKHISYFPYLMKDISGQPLKTEVKDVNTVIVLQSRDRDRSIFPQPMDCQLFLPRIYKNITSFSVVQINLTSAFFYFRADKENITVQITEKDRVLYSPQLVPSSFTNPLKITTTIREGSYNIDSLVAELTLQLNRTPLFYDFINGFSDFNNAFSINGDFSVNFNYPGDTYYDALTKTFIPNPTKATITSYYFQSQFGGQSSYTPNQVKIAYYYPVLKEVLLDPVTQLNELNLDYTDPTTGLPLYPEDVRLYLIYNFTGLNDPVALQIVNQNTPYLDTYRLQHTFRYSLVNKYQCGYDPRNNRFFFLTKTLNTSLVNLLNTQYNNFFLQAIAAYNLTPAQYSILVSQNTNILAILQSMYEFLNLQFATYFAVNYGTYSRSYFSYPNYSVLIKNGINASNVLFSYNPSIIGISRDTDLLQSYQTPPPYYWKGLTNLGTTTGPPVNMGAATGSFPTTSNFAYSVATSNIDLDHRFIDLSGNIYNDLRRRAGDILVDVQATKYTIFKFRSKIRQTLQVESLPRQYIYRYPNYNSNYSAQIQNLYDASYAYIHSPSLDAKLVKDISNNIFPVIGWSAVAGTTTNFGFSFTQSEALWGTNYLSITPQLTYRGLSFQTPRPLLDTNIYTYPFQIAITSPGPLPTTLVAFLYHDLAAFAADMSGVRFEAPVNYKQKISISVGTQSNSFPLTSYNDQTYYILVRSETATNVPSTEFRVVPFFPQGTVSTALNKTQAYDPALPPETQLNFWDVAQVNDPNYIRLPVQKALWSDSSPLNDYIQNVVYPAAPPIGYDGSNVSNDLTDYIPFSNSGVSNINPLAAARGDPTNRYIFQYNSNTPYNSNTSIQSYFYTGSSNQLYTPNSAQAYSWSSTGVTRQYKMVQYYATTYLPDNLPILPYTSDDISPYVAPYTPATTSNTELTGYSYQGANNYLYLDQGVCGYSFLPSDGTWNMRRIMFKTNFLTTNPNKNLNEQIQFLAIFVTASMMSQNISELNPANALAICVKEGSQTYTAANTATNGFDSGLGTYYTFSNFPALSSNAPLTGYSQIGKEFIPDSNSYYSIVAYGGLSQTLFTQAATGSAAAIAALKAQLSNAQIRPIRNMTGTPIPYPYAGNEAYPSLTFYDGKAAPTGASVVLSTSNLTPSPFGPPAGYDQSVVQYEQSIPYVNSHIHYLSQSNIVQDASGFQVWSGNPPSPTSLCASVRGYMLFQNGQFSIAPYKWNTTFSANPARTFSNISANLTVDQIFPAAEATSLLAVAGNTNSYIFLGSSNSYLRFKVFTPSTGALTELPTSPFYTLSTTNRQIQQFVFHNSGRWFLSAFNSATNQLELIGDTTYRTNTAATTWTYPGFSNSELQMDPSGAYLYFAKKTGPLTGFTSFSLFSFDSADPGYFLTDSNGYTINLQTGGTLPANYQQISVSLTGSIERVLLLSQTLSPNHFFSISRYSAGTGFSSNTTITQSLQEFRDLSNTLISPQRIFPSSDGGSWALFGGANPTIMGNRNDAVDNPTFVKMAWQIFFPTMKLEFTKVSNSSTSLTDLTGIDTSGNLYPEWPHSMMFGYSNYTSLLADISGGAANGKWGLESNFLVSDISFNGFYFNSYLMNFPLYPNVNCNSSSAENYYYLAMRGYLPSEQFQTMLRFYAPNRYDFGILRLRDISDEIVFSQANSSNRNLFAPAYYSVLQQFNSNFVFTNKIFGNNQQGFSGSNYTSSNFGDFLTIYANLYSQYNSNNTIITAIQNNITSNLNAFISSNLPYILPSSALTRQRYTDPLLFKIWWKSALTPNFLKLEDEWGLGWNLGYAKEDTPFSTVQNAESFFKIQQDYIYLRLNPEFNINRMDAGGKENYRETREPSGTTNQYYCKLLLTNFGGNSTTFIHNPIIFNPPLNRLTKIQFEWYYPNGTLIDNNDAEWNTTINIVEKVEVPIIPAKMPFTPLDPKTSQPAPLPEGLQPPKDQGQGKDVLARDKAVIEMQKQVLKGEIQREKGNQGKLRNS